MAAARLKQAGGLALVLAALWLAPAAAQDEPDAAPDPANWQQVITGQIEAFRAGWDAAALFYAGSAFRRTYSDPAAFVESIRNSGYAPIMDSTAHEFGAYNLLEDDQVLQLVRLSGANLHSYEALYRLGLEPEGWRVNGVMLREVPGVNI